MRERLEGVDRLLDRPRRRTREPCHRDRGQGVLQVVAPDEPDPRQVVAFLAGPGEPQRHVSLAGEGAARHRRRPERHEPRPEVLGDAPHDRIVPVQDREVLRLLAREEAGLGGGIGLERAVPVEMVRRQVDEAPDPRPELLHPLELEARHLGDRHVGVAADGGDQGRAEVAADEGTSARPCERETHEARGRALAVRAGDGDHGARKKRRRHLDLAPHRKAAPKRGREQRRLARHPGAGDDEVHAGEQLGAFLAEPELDVLPLARLDPQRFRRTPVGHPHPDTTGGEHPGDRLAGALEPQDERLAREGHQRSLRVDSARSAQTIDTIQKRTMIWGSGQPKSSK